MEKLSHILWRERELLETLLFKLEQEQMVLLGGRDRWLMRAAGEVEAVVLELRETEILRAVAVREIVSTLGVPSDASLSEIAAVVDQPWRGILLDHHEVLSGLTAELAAVAEGNTELIDAGYQALRVVAGVAEKGC